MKNILLVCAAGMSTSMLVNKMEEAAKEKEEEININASSGGDVSKYIEDAHILLLGPQVSYLKKQYESDYSSKGIPVEVIDSLDYGTMNGKKVLDWALNTIENNN
ncbi:PTS sugar transporter subunit IIB [Salipaludibacillus agaradhaerens]|jgi:PTS system cellobiose-specific IIB component|uniref:PTS sugar transporter subunit IIB n=1 Tax=Salipaludibacillus agaradhaerens TaxID=76935 RepID=A0A9Q4B4Y0_SALAG|nr:PTS sugar transporter subunit IIB [Salipaludibacillus agaradhaerens]MCR6098050.1 PTS sugar transporter subunit IIB [Salipaludibacillus agaradhaerens]MCR6116321.1 PTS sugar transporter subunit IIB [Salipaludibacillus agaradhaerens]